MYAPLIQPIVSRALAEAMAGNGTRLLSFIQTAYTRPPGHSGAADLSRMGVTCADSPFTLEPTAEDLADQLLIGLKRHGRFGASPIFTEVSHIHFDLHVELC
jgi:hypothetical protein